MFKIFSVCRKKNKKPILFQDPEIKPIRYCSLYRYATNWDRFLIFISITCCILGGLALPVKAVLFGTVTGDMIKTGKKMEEEKSQNNTAAVEKSAREMISIAQKFAINICILSLLLCLVHFISLLVINIVALNQVFIIRGLFFKSILNQDISWFDLHSTGDFSSRISDDLLKLEDGIGEKLVIYIFNQIAILVNFITAFVVGWKFAFLCLLSIPLAMILIILIGLIVPKIAVRAMQINGEASTIAEEVFSLIRTVTAFGGQKKETDRYYEKLKIVKYLNVKLSWLSSSANGLLMVIIFSSFALSFWYGVKFVLSGEYEPKTMFIVFTCALIGSMTMGYGTTYLKIFATATAAGAKIFHIIKTKPVINSDKYRGKRPSHVLGKITFNNVTFHYPSRVDVPVLRGLNLTINPGETIALVGSSGCGKSTCIQLMQRFYDPVSGSISLDDNDIRSLDLVWLREHIGVVNQEPVLFGMTIEENIKLGKLSATKDEIIEAAKRANADEFVTQLPDGYDTLIGDRGAQLSGGQKQRIAIARALVRNPSILLLDEATSALDTNSEAKVQAALDNVSKNITTIIVAHRLSTVRNADKIVVVSEGKIIETGTHDELIAKQAAYYNLVTAQVDAEHTSNEHDGNIEYINTKQTKHFESFAADADASVAELFIKKRQAKFCNVIKENSSEWIQLTAGSIASIISGTVVPTFAILFGGIVQILVHVDKEYIINESNKFSLLFLLAGFVIGLSTLCEGVMFNIASEKLVMRLKLKMFKAILRQDMAWFDKPENGVGSLCARISTETAKVQIGTGERIGTLFQAMSVICISIGLSIYLEYRLGLIAFLTSVLIMMSLFFQEHLTNRQNKEIKIITESATKLAVEALYNIRTVVSLGREKKFYKMYMESLRPSYKTVIIQVSLRSLAFSTSRSLAYFAYAICIYVGSILVAQEGLKIGTIFTICHAVILGTTSISAALAFVPNLQRGIAATIEIINTIQEQPKIVDSPRKSTQVWNESKVVYSKIKFSYPTRPNVQVLDDFNLSIQHGQTVALVGHSGCGKSTIIQLLERFYDPDSGKITIEKKNIKHISLSLLRSRMSIVSQEPALFDRTIQENIAYGDNSRFVPKEEIVEAATKANIHNFIASLPMGYDTSLGEKGTQLSGGQKQRIAIARALIRDPKILLLDEATSALDAESEKIVQEALDKTRQGRTCIIIAHRLSTIQDADVICVMNHGKIEEMGTHSQLISQRGLYYHLYSLQSS